MLNVTRTHESFLSCSVTLLKTIWVGVLTDQMFMKQFNVAHRHLLVCESFAVTVAKADISRELADKRTDRWKTFGEACIFVIVFVGSVLSDQMIPGTMLRPFRSDTSPQYGTSSLNLH